MVVDIKTELISIIHKHLPGCKIMLFGSRARGTQASGADYDIAIDTGKKIPSTTMLHISSDIEDSNIFLHVDVVDLHAVSEKFLACIKEDFITLT